MSISDIALSRALTTSLRLASLNVSAKESLPQTNHDSAVAARSESFIAVNISAPSSPDSARPAPAILRMVGGLMKYGFPPTRTVLHSVFSNACDTIFTPSMLIRKRGRQRRPPILIFIPAVVVSPATRFHLQTYTLLLHLRIPTPCRRQ